MNKEIKNKVYHTILGSLLITVNIYFAIFVWMKSDLTPNIALAVWTLPFAIIEIKKALTIIKKKNE